jgi:quercetin dioxygenase-like cupin family protein
MKPVRRLVTLDDATGRSRAIADGPAPAVHTDPARPGFSSTLIWVTDRTPARISTESLNAPHRAEPPPGGSVCRIVRFPPETRLVKLQKARTLDFCLVLEGEITLVLDLEEVHLKAGDTVVQRGTNHAWSNRSARPCVVAISSHDAVEEPNE